jgi:hypothetical protein
LIADVVVVDQDKRTRLKRRGDFISFIDVKHKMDDKFLSELKGDISLGRWDKIRFGDAKGKGNEVYVLSNSGEGFVEKEIMYDIVEQDIDEVVNRLSRTASFYINKYEKVNRIK